VLPKLASGVPCFKADSVVLAAVPDIGLTYLTRLGTCANIQLQLVNESIKIQTRALSILTVKFLLSYFFIINRIS